jgi:hypothetical protein
MENKAINEGRRSIILFYMNSSLEIDVMFVHHFE